MVKPIDITRTVIVPKPRVKQEKLGSFFIGHVDQIVEPMTTEIEVEVKSMRNNAVNIEFLKKRTEKLTEDVEKIIRNGSKH